MSSCHSCIAAGRCQRTYSERACAAAAPRPGRGGPGSDAPSRATATAPAAPARASARARSAAHPTADAPAAAHTPAPPAPPTPDSGSTAAAATDPPAPPTPPRDTAPPTHAPTGATPRPRAATSLTARAVQHRHHRPIPLLDNRQRHQCQSRPPAQSAEQPITASGVNHVLRLRCQACPETGQPARRRCRVRIFSTTSRRPSAAAGCARLASLAVLAGQHRDHQRQRTHRPPARAPQRLRLAPTSVGVKWTATQLAALGPAGLHLTPPAASADARVKVAAPGLLPGRAARDARPGRRSRRLSRPARSAAAVPVDRARAPNQLGLRMAPSVPTDRPLGG